MNIAAFLRVMRADIAVEDAGPITAASFVEAAAREAMGRPHAVFLSGSEHDCSQRSIALLLPAAILRVKQGTAALRTAHGLQQEKTDPFDLLAAAREGLRHNNDLPYPPAIGGYIAYEAAHAIEQFSARAEDTLGLPDLLFFWPTRMLLRDHATERMLRCTLRWRSAETILPEMKIDATAADSTGPDRSMDQRTPASGLQRSFTRTAYEAAVARVRRHIYDGDVYQVNLSQRFVFPLAQEAYALWRRLFEANPAPFYAYVDGGDHQVLSTSMERLLRIEPDPAAGDRIETRPIKGTRPRGTHAAEDAERERELRTSTKDDAELSMIVDLARNDIGRVCRAGSVRVREHKRVERYANVMHLVSVVEGRLRRDADIAEVFRALFPGGSITGCPKIRAMEIIDDNEPVTRHVYTGSIGLMEADGTVDFNIAIRTAVVRDGCCHLSVGGGIVYDSDPAEEYFETLHKGETFFRCAGIDPQHAEE